MINHDLPLYSLTVGQFLELQNIGRSIPEPKQALPKYLSPVDLSEMVNWKLTTVYQNHHAGRIPGAVKIGNRLLFERSIIEKWIQENAIPTRAEKVRNIEKQLKKR